MSHDRSSSAPGIGTSPTRQYNTALLRTVGKTADDLGKSVAKSLSTLESAERPVQAAADGFTFVPALTNVFTSWDRRLSALRGESWSIAATFHSTAATDRKVEGDLATGINNRFTDLINFRDGG